MSEKKKTIFALKSLAIPMPDGQEITFWFDGNSKVTLGKDDFDNPIANAFSLVQVQDCPYATSVCKSVCYVHLLEKHEAVVHAKYHLNSKLIRSVLSNPDYQEATQIAFSDWIAVNCQAGFRWHISGDIFSLPYAHFISKVCQLTPEVSFWIYTRSFEFLQPLVGLSNLVVNLSADAANIVEANLAHKKYGLRLCYLTIDGSLPDLSKGSVIFPAHNLRGRDLQNPTQAPWWQTLTLEQRKMVCPPDFFGQNEKRRCGPCQKCLVS